MIKTILANDLSSKEGMILDVRTDMECLEKSLGCVHEHVPLDKLNPKDFMSKHGLTKDFPLFILCRSGQRATQAAEKFIKEGMTNVYVIEGGINACEACGEKIVSRKHRGLSLERQVRIAAGLLVFSGTLLGIYINPVFLALPVFVGAGLIFAGVTDRCGMALLLTRMPWNKI